MRFCAYMTICLSLPFALLAGDDEKDEAESSPEGTAAAVETETDPGFERFKTILDRMPFGRPPPGFDPDSPSGSVQGKQGAEAAAEAAAAAAEVSASEQQIISSVRVSVLNVTPAGKVFVGFTDSSVQPPRNYLLELGEKREHCEWQVVAADPESREVTLSKDGIEAKLKVGGGNGASNEKPAKEGEPGGKAAAHPVLAHGRVPPTMAPGPGAEEGGDRKMSALDRVRARRKAHLERQQAEEERQRQAAEQARRDREQEAEERKQARMEREQAAEERKQLAEARQAQLDQLAQIQEELRRQREARAAEQRAEDEQAPPQGGAQEPNEE